ncbi:8-amino-7-oxononanoate synthase [Photobacterium aquae]|uniref:8-amino-7-oxononanoate synthase n=1 Tax=Photobacterium aquae TaxID=1195763 RepID=A0A0J1GYV4_9GAMM|nr:8-amino-7-oxononanoate synthase [Photobacterium aquae]KLV04823.1 8-amino-7-oxononanoate synthase [Photobacterium aquae]
MTHHYSARIQQALGQRKALGLYRNPNTVCRLANQPNIYCDEQPYLNFSSNDYLGLAQSAELISAWQDGLARFGAGSGASPLVTGQHVPHRNLESRLCEWLGFERALLFSSGFAANQALLFTLLDDSDVLFQDRLNHASLMEAGILSSAVMRRFAHNDTASLAKLLARLAPEQASIVVTEGVFSMDGDMSPLADIRALSLNAQSMMLVDDAHGCGVLGNDGRGSCELAGIKPDILVVTFGKAFGLQGAAVMCSQEIAEYLIQFARHYIYSTAMPPAQAHALGVSCEMIQRDQWRREKLAELSECLSGQLKHGVGLIDTQTPIKPLVVGSSERALSLSSSLRRKGFWVAAIRPPTVPVNGARLRITLTAAHSVGHVEQLATALNEVMDDE